MEIIRNFFKPVIDLQRTGAQIKKLREKNRFSIRELQLIFGFEHPQAIYAWEHGKNIPTIDNMLILAQLFKVELGEIIVFKMVEVSLPCSEHAASCMNDIGKFCLNKRFMEIA